MVVKKLETGPKITKLLNIASKKEVKEKSIKKIRQPIKYSF